MGGECRRQGENNVYEVLAANLSTQLDPGHRGWKPASTASATARPVICLICFLLKSYKHSSNLWCRYAELAVSLHTELKACLGPYLPRQQLQPVLLPYANSVLPVFINHNGTSGINSYITLQPRSGHFGVWVQ
jgi:hypothetical protein